MERPGDVAAATFKEGFNCAQAVLSAFGERFGVSREQAMRLAAGFGGGMGRQGLTCGAVTGAFMVLGLKTGATRADDAQAKLRTQELVRSFSRKFSERHRSIACRELIGFDISTSEGFEQAKQAGVFTEFCPRLVREAAEIVEELISTSETT
jgi:C_GCAxxG_C_C family probable redox protein